MKCHLEGEVLLSAAVVGLAPVGVEVDRVGLAGQVLQELVLLHQLRPQRVHLVVLLVAQRVQLVLKKKRTQMFRAKVQTFCF